MRMDQAYGKRFAGDTTNQMFELVGNGGPVDVMVKIWRKEDVR